MVATTTPQTPRARLASAWPILLPVVVPVLAAVIMALLFRQPGLLVFGLMGPLLAWTQAIGRKKQTLERDAREALASAEAEASARHDARARVEAWRDEAEKTTPPVSQWLENPLWRPEESSSTTLVRLGVASLMPPKELGWTVPVPDTPFSVPLHSSLALVGDHGQAVAVWRALWCQAAAIIARGSLASSRAVVAAWWPYNEEVPDFLDIPDESGGQHSRWQRYRSVADVSPEATLVVVVGLGGSASLYRRGVAIQESVTPDRLSFSQARWVRTRLTAHDGETAEASAEDLDERGSLWCDVGSSSTAVDFVERGPHAGVWGKTGSGKSVLVQRLVLSLCQRYAPDRLAIVGIDFKGGATLQPLARLPHFSGSVTDLTVSIANRVARSLAAEIRAREELFHSQQVATWSELDEAVACPRVLIVVDEAGVVASQAAELMAVISDVASRGRSLGLHLLLSTQRPHQLPTNIIANCALRVCLGVTDQEEAARYLEGVPTGLLRRLVSSRPGEVLWPGRGDTPQIVPVDPVTDQEVRDLQRFGHPPASRLWLEPLPDVIDEPGLDVQAAADGEFLIGLLDDPDNQRIVPATYSPRRDGPLVIVGESGSGHTASLQVVAILANTMGIPVVWATGPAENFCHTLMQTLHRLRETDDDLVVVVDRLDRILSASPADAEAWVMETLSDIALQMGALGNRSCIAVSTGPGHTTHSALLRWAATPILLRHLVSDQWAMSGGHPSSHDKAAPPGRADRGGMAMQWRLPDGQAVTQTIDTHPAPAGCLVVGNRLPETHQHTLLSAADADGQWSSISQGLAAGKLVLTELSPQGMRQLVTGGRVCPPVMAHLPYGWWFTPEGPVLVTVD